MRNIALFFRRVRLLGRFAAIAALIALGTSLGGCAGNGHGSGMGPGEMFGTASGAAIGALVGNTIGGGSGNLLATVTLGVLGAVVGNDLGRATDLARQPRQQQGQAVNLVQPGNVLDCDVYVSENRSSGGYSLGGTQRNYSRNCRGRETYIVPAGAAPRRY